jgi:hypothetical protein
MCAGERGCGQRGRWCGLSPALVPLATIRWCELLGRAARGASSVPDRLLCGHFHTRLGVVTGTREGWCSGLQGQRASVVRRCSGSQRGHSPATAPCMSRGATFLLHVPAKAMRLTHPLEVRFMLR